MRRDLDHDVPVDQWKWGEANRRKSVVESGVRGGIHEPR